MTSDFFAQEQALSEQVKSAVAEKQSVEIVGGGTRPWIGRDVSCDTRLSTTALSGVLSYEPSELVLRVGAGTPISEITEVLNQQSQMLAFEPHCIGAKKASTIGGALASSMSGAARPWLGGVSDHVLGLGLINGRGDALRFGGQVMKNVAGYDVSRAMVGSLGCFGVITEVSLKVLPKPLGERYVIQKSGLSEALNLGALLDRTMTMRTGLAWKDGHVHVRLSGSPEAIKCVCAEHQLEASDEIDPFWSQLNNLTLPIFEHGNEPLWRIVAPKYSDLSKVFDAGRLLMDWAGGQYWVRASRDEMQNSIPVLKALGAHCYSWSVGDMYTLEALPSGVLGLHVSLKRAFDPDGIFNIGRMSEAF